MDFLRGFLPGSLLPTRGQNSISTTELAPFLFTKIYMDNEEIKINAKSCWIHGSILEAATRNYGGQDINIYSKPDLKSKPLYVIKGEQEYVTYIDLKEGWAKVS